MHLQAISIYYICDEIVNFLGVKDDSQCKMTTSEVMTFCILSALNHYGDYNRTRLVSKKLYFFKQMLSQSRMIRRIHSIPENVWKTLFQILQLALKTNNQHIFIVDSFPVKAYQNYKSSRAKIFSDKKYHGYSASKKEYFFGLKVHMVVDINRIPVEFRLEAASESDITSLERFDLDLPPGAVLLGDKAYTKYKLEDELREQKQIFLIPKRQKNYSRQNTPREIELLKNRNKIEIAFSNILGYFPKYIRAKTERGFLLKITFFILAYMVKKLPE